MCVIEFTLNWLSFTLGFFHLLFHFSLFSFRHLLHPFLLRLFYIPTMHMTAVCYSWSRTNIGMLKYVTQPSGVITTRIKQKSFQAKSLKRWFCMLFVSLFGVCECRVISLCIMIVTHWLSLEQATLSVCTSTIHIEIWINHSLRFFASILRTYISFRHIHPLIKEIDICFCVQASTPPERNCEKCEWIDKHVMVNAIDTTQAKQTIFRFDRIYERKKFCWRRN